MRVLGALSCAALACSTSPLSTEPPTEDGVYSTSRHLPALNVDVALVKTPSRVFARLPDGTELGVADLMAREASAHHDRFGSFDSALDARVAGMGDGELLVAVEYEGGPSSVSLVPSDTLEARHHRLLATSASATARLEALGFHVTRASDAMPLLFGRATRSTLLALRAVDGIRVRLDDTGAEIKNSAPNSATHARIDVAFAQPSAAGSYASNQNIGILESYASPLYDDHEAFDFNRAPITYLAPPSYTPCATPADCGTGESCHPGGWCVEQHGSIVASAISATKQGQPWSSAGARLYLHNGTVAGGGGPCSLSGVDAAYSAFLKAGVSVVNRSYSCLPGDGIGEVSDYYARTFGMHTAKAAANAGGGVTLACPWTLNAICVGSTTRGYALGSHVFENPGDRQEPDIVSLGEEVDVLGFGFRSDWAAASGTSLATGIVSSMIALVRERCLANGKLLIPRAARAYLRQAGWERNITGWRYETPSKLGAWGQDGGGYSFADAAAAWCEPHVGQEQGDALVNLRNGSIGPVGSPPPEAPPQAKAEGISLLGGARPGPNDGRRYQLLQSWTNLAQGTRLRAVVSWDACAVLNADPVAIARPDFDLFLYAADPSLPRYVYSSQSFDDNEEGFDVTLQSAGSYALYVAWPNGATGCGGTDAEPLFWTTQWQ